MRISARMALVAIALGLLAGPGAIATPLRCASPCEIVTTSNGYIGPVTEIASGDTVSWVGSEGSHPTSDSTDAAGRCFIVPVGPGATPIPVRFDVAADGSVTATQAPGTPDETTRTCSAVPAGGDSTLLPYHCMLHSWMHGALLITG